MTEQYQTKSQNVTLKDRREIKISGIISVDSFDENRICATCSDELHITIDGFGLSIREVNLESGYVEAEGEIQGFFYESPVRKAVNGIFGGSFLKK